MITELVSLNLTIKLNDEMSDWLIRKIDECHLKGQRVLVYKNTKSTTTVFILDSIFTKKESTQTRTLLAF